MNREEMMNMEEIFDLVRKHICEVIPNLENHELKDNDALVDLGANSVDRADIITMTMESLGLQIPRVELYGLKNIGELVDVLYKKSKSI